MKSGGFLMHPGRLSPQARQNVRGPNGQQQAAPENPAAPLEKQGGLDNAHRVKVLEEGMKFVPTTIPPEDAQRWREEGAALNNVAAVRLALPIQYPSVGTA